MEVMAGVKNVIQRLERDIENQVRAYNQVSKSTIFYQCDNIAYSLLFVTKKAL